MFDKILCPLGIAQRLRLSCMRQCERRHLLALLRSLQSECTSFRSPFANLHARRNTQHRTCDTHGD